MNPFFKMFGLTVGVVSTFFVVMTLLLVGLYGSYTVHYDFMVPAEFVACSFGIVSLVCMWFQLVFKKEV